MYIAYFINNNGEKVELDAHDDNCNRYRGRLRCPCCGEQVIWVNGPVRKRYFRHERGTYMEECENYSSSISEIGVVSPYKRESLSLYLIKDLGGFSLKVGLRAVGSDTINEAEKMDLIVNIENDEEIIGSKVVSFNYFFPDEINFIPISQICEQYKMKFSKEKVPEEIKSKWSIIINGIGKNGAIFSNHGDIGKKITSNKGIIINQKYLLLTQKRYGYNHIEGANFSEIEQVNFGGFNKYFINKFIISEMNVGTDEFAKGFGLELKYKAEEIIPIWPPCSLIEDELIYNRDSEKFFSYYTDNIDQYEIYSYKLKNTLTSHYIDKGNYLVKSPIRSNDYIRIGSLNNSINYSIVRKDYLTKKDDYNIDVKTHSGNVEINTDRKVFMNLYSGDFLLESKVITNECYSTIVEKDNKIEILYGLDRIWEYTNKLDVIKDKYNSQKDKGLLLRIIECKGELVSVPTDLTWKILKLKYYELSYKELIKRVRTGKVSIKLINLLKESL